MPYQPINLGIRGDNQTGDDLNEGGDKINDNFVELYGTKLESVVGGTNTTIDNTDPLNPVINVTVPVTITNTSDLVNDGSDGTSTYVENDEIGTLALLDTIGTTELENASVTLSKMANATAFSILGNNTGSSVTPIYLTTTQVRSLLNVADGAAPNQSLSIVGDQLTISGGNTVTIPTGGGGLTVDSVITDGSNNPVTNNAIHDALVNINSYVATGNIQADKLLDGPGSGLDADTLDGIQGSSYLRSDTNDETSGNLYVNNGASYQELGIIRDISGDKKTYLAVASPTGYSIFGHSDGTTTKYLVLGQAFPTYNDGAITHNIWTSGNDGSGSGLDADLLDGIHATSFIRKDTSDTKTSGTLDFNDNVALRFGSSGAESNIISNGTNTYWSLTNGDLIIRDGGTNRIIFNRTTGGAIFNGDITVPDEVYGSGWNGSVEVPTKNAVYDKIETLIGVTPTSGIGSSGLTLIGGTSGSYTISSQSWAWTKIGRIVSFSIELSGISGSSPVGQLQLNLSGGSFPSINADALFQVESFSFPTNYYSIHGRSSGTELITFKMSTTLDGNNDVEATSVDFVSGNLVITGTYITT